MSKLGFIFIVLLVFSTHSQAFEPELQQQGMFYYHLSFDVGQSSKPDHYFGFRMDNGLVKPGETMQISELVSRPAVLDINFNNNGLRSFAIHGVDYTSEYYVARADETETEEVATDAEAAETETAEPEPVVAEETPLKKLDIPLGVVIGAVIGLVAIAGAGN